MCHSDFSPRLSGIDARKRRDYELADRHIDHMRSSSDYWASEAIRMRNVGDVALWVHYMRNAINTRIYAQALVTERERRGI